MRLAKKVFRTRKKTVLRPMFFRADGIAQIGDAGNDAEDQQRDDHSRNDVGVDGTHSGDIGVVALEHKAHNEAEAHSQNGAHAEVNVLFPVQVVQQGKKVRQSEPVRPDPEFLQT